VTASIFVLQRLNWVIRGDWGLDARAIVVVTTAERNPQWQMDASWVLLRPPASVGEGRLWYKRLQNALLDGGFHQRSSH
jgi:hypothetical protein